MIVATMSTKNARILGIRLDQKTNARLVRFENTTLIEGVSLARAALIAALETYERHGSLTLPLKIISFAQNENLFTPLKIISFAQNENLFTSQVSENLMESTACKPPNIAKSATSTVISPAKPPDKEPANLVKLPPPPVLASLNESLVESPNLDSPRQDVTYPKGRRKKA
jgi:hypothetical protein